MGGHDLVLGGGRNEPTGTGRRQILRVMYFTSPATGLRVGITIIKHINQTRI